MPALELTCSQLPSLCSRVSTIRVPSGIGWIERNCIPRALISREQPDTRTVESRVQDWTLIAYSTG